MVTKDAHGMYSPCSPGYRPHTFVPALGRDHRNAEDWSAHHRKRGREGIDIGEGANDCIDVTEHVLAAIGLGEGSDLRHHSLQLALIDQTRNGDLESLWIGQ